MSVLQCWIEQEGYHFFSSVMSKKGGKKREEFCLKSRRLLILWFRWAVISIWLPVTFHWGGCSSPGSLARCMWFAGFCCWIHHFTLIQCLLWLTWCFLQIGTRLIQQWHTVAKWDSASPNWRMLFTSITTLPYKAFYCLLHLSKRVEAILRIHLQFKKKMHTKNEWDELKIMSIDVDWMAYMKNYPSQLWVWWVPV